MGGGREACFVEARHLLRHGPVGSPGLCLPGHSHLVPTLMSDLSLQSLGAMVQVHTVFCVSIMVLD
jgi:hypothetical protein